MKNTILLCILSAVAAAGITYYITGRDYASSVEHYLEGLEAEDDSLLTISTQPSVNQFRPCNASGVIDTLTAGEMTGMFRQKLQEGSLGKSEEFILPLAWTFDACDLRRVIGRRDKKVKRVRIYGGVYKNCGDSKNYFTLIVAGVDDKDKDIVKNKYGSVLFEYADPCPPKCLNANTCLLPAGECKTMTITGFRRSNEKGDASYDEVTCK